MRAFLEKIIMVSTLALMVFVSATAIGITLTASTHGEGSLTIDASQQFQTLDGFGVNINSASWKNGELRPAIDMLVDQLGATIFRVVIDNGDWETTNDNGDPHTLNWAFYKNVYTGPKFEALWATMAYLNQKAITQHLMLSIMGPVASWMGGLRINPAAEDEWVEMITSLIYHARVTRNLQFGLLSPMNEPDWDGIEGPRVGQSQYVRLMHRLSRKLDALGLSSVRLMGPDTASADRGVQAYFPEMMADATLMAKLAHFGLHNYAGYMPAPGKRSSPQPIPARISGSPKCRIFGMHSRKWLRVQLPSSCGMATTVFMTMRSWRAGVPHLRMTPAMVQPYSPTIPAPVHIRPAKPSMSTRNSSGMLRLERAGSPPRCPTPPSPSSPFTIPRRSV
jgi:hypothetical protein